MRIAVDAMGGDHAPEPIVRGALHALQGDDDLRLVLVGDRDRLDPLVPPTADHDRLSFEHTTQVVTMDDNAPLAMRRKPDASIFKCWELLAAGRVEGLVSAGHTGAAVAGGFRRRRFLPSIERPGIAVTVPHPTGTSIMCDVGANIEPTALHLAQYGLMGVQLAKTLLNIDKPMIGLLNVGSEADKGTGLARQTQQLFNESSLREHFYGNVEGRDICRGVVDVIVCDGFAGNIALKCCEGMVDFLMRSVGQELLSSLDAERDIAARSLKRLHTRYHYSEFGGAPLLGVEGVCLICHGSSDDKAISNAVLAVKRYHAANKLMVEELKRVGDELKQRYDDLRRAEGKTPGVVGTVGVTPAPANG